MKITKRQIGYFENSVAAICAQLGDREYVEVVEGRLCLYGDGRWVVWLAPDGLSYYGLGLCSLETLLVEFGFISIRQKFSSEEANCPLLLGLLNYHLKIALRCLTRSVKKRKK